MNLRLLLLYGVLLVLVRPTLGPAQIQTLPDVIADVSKNVKGFEDQLPDFLCTEKIISTRLESGRVSKQKYVESVFTAVQKSSRPENLRLSFTESREVKAIDGEPVAPKTEMLDLTERDPKKTATYLAEYSDSKKFTASVQIKIQP